MLRNLSRYRQLNLLSVAALVALTVVGTLQVLGVSDGWRLAGHLIVICRAVGAGVCGVRHSADKPTWLLPRVVFVFVLGSLTTLIAGDYLRAVVCAILAVILPLSMLDDRWNTLFRYRTDS